MTTWILSLDTDDDLFLSYKDDNKNVTWMEICINGKDNEECRNKLIDFVRNIKVSKKGRGEGFKEPRFFKNSLKVLIRHLKNNGDLWYFSGGNWTIDLKPFYGYTYTL